MTRFAATRHLRTAERDEPKASLRPWLVLVFLSIAATMDAVNSTVLVVTRGHLMGGTHATPDEDCLDQHDLPRCQADRAPCIRLDDVMRLAFTLTGRRHCGAHRQLAGVFRHG